MSGTPFIQFNPVRILCLLLFVFLNMGSLKAQTTYAAEYQLKAVFLYNFTRFIDWPVDAFDSPYTPFVIGIIGDDPFVPFVQAAVHGERLGTHLIHLKRFESIDQIEDCHILYIASKNPDELKSMIKDVSGKNILTVGDAPNFARYGGMIRFYTEQSKIRLQINNTAAKAEGLKISSKLLRVAQVF